MPEVQGHTPFTEVCQSLKRLIELHEILHDACRLEHAALVTMELKQIEDQSLRKQLTVEAIQVEEQNRLLAVSQVARLWKRPIRELSLSIIVEGAALEKEGSELRAAFEALKKVVSQVTEANQLNRDLVTRSLEHVEQMKRNVLGEAVPKATTYNPQGQRQAQTNGARLLSTEI